MQTSWPELRKQCLILEDEAVLALNKPAGISVTGERHDTDIVELAAGQGETLYPVHRIDKVTSGLVLLAKELKAHGELTRQFNKRTAQKAYLAVVEGDGLPDRGVIELPLSVGRKNRVRIAAPRESIRRDGDRWRVDAADVLAGKNYPSVTEFVVVTRTSEHTVLALRPITGRRHQIRVHLAWIGHAIVGDPLFDRSGTHARTYLHSWRLSLEASWRSPAELALEAIPGPDFWQLDGKPLGDTPGQLLGSAAELMTHTTIDGH
ncbi:RluA family pseudouridine synthase [Nocardia huaxiensis]|uniref:RNA pseudouridylate synthase n=1 Tax=Nocardia huaxiensis TaxID=2755382 RepID=A0A7D6ZID1_9NOCA|nr:RNA pseudouridine synthase [Nocardia huaxiensis]QLY31699.1 RNA pseudouridine synthase [Nocardia huaxiensis]UFS95255.1 RNA pseudouridine synthase [Nocardia huaxiensis]